MTGMRGSDSLPGFVREITDRVARVERRGSEPPNGLAAGVLIVVLDPDQLPDDAEVGAQAYVDSLGETWARGVNGNWAKV